MLHVCGRPRMCPQWDAPALGRKTWEMEMDVEVGMEVTME